MVQAVVKRRVRNNAYRTGRFTPLCRAGLCLFGLVMQAMTPVSAQDYPTRPIRMISSTAGGNADAASRVVATGIAAPLGQPVIVENRPGFESQLTVSKAAPDGYTVLFTGQSQWTAPLLRKVPYDPVRDFGPLVMVTATPCAFAVHPSVPAKSIKELITLARAQPGKLNYAMAAVGGTSHLAPELLKSMAGVNIVQVPYKGTSPSVTGILSGEVDLIVQDLGSIGPHTKSGKLRALAVTTSQPTALMPGVPPVAATLPGFEAVGRTAMFVPPKTPAAIVRRLNQEVVRVLSQADVKDKFATVGIELVPGTPEQLAAAIDADMARWGKLIKDAGIKTE